MNFNGLSQTIEKEISNTYYGQYIVGHKKTVLYDSTRFYDFSMGDSTLNIDNHNRPLLLNIYFPAKNSRNAKAISLCDLWDFKSFDLPPTFSEKFMNYESEMSQLYAVNDNLKLDQFKGDSATMNTTRNEIFKTYMNATIRSKDNLQPIDDNLPIVVYHQGLGGTFDENLVLVELLASHGYLVITSSFINNDSWNLGVGDTDASIKDIDFIINYTQKNLTRNKNTFLLGHSFGANTILTYPSNGAHKINGLIPLDSDYSYAFKWHMKNQFAQNLDMQKNLENIDILAIARTSAHFRKIDQLNVCNRILIKIKNITHNDFCSQTITGANDCLPFLKNKDAILWQTEQYTKICHFVERFITSSLKNTMDKKTFWNSQDSALEIITLDPFQMTAFNETHRLGKGVCPSSSQLLDIIIETGMPEACNEWSNCSNLIDTTAFDFDWLGIYEALLDDSSTEKAIAFLDCFIKSRAGNYNMAGFSYFTNESSYVDSGDGIHIQRAAEIFDWLMIYFPNEIEFFKGKILSLRVLEYHSPENEQAFRNAELKKACHQFISQYPNYWKIKSNDSWDETVRNIIQKNTTESK